MKIMLISDSHDAWANLQKAIEIANYLEVQHIIHCGDFVTPTGLALFEKFKGQVHMVWGNNEGEKVGFIRKVDSIANITHYGDTMEKEFDGLKFFANHYPHIGEIAALSGQYDVVVHGHDHLYKDKIVNSTRLLNPGELVGTRTGVATVMVFDTQTKNADKIIIKENIQPML